VSLRGLKHATIYVKRLKHIHLVSAAAVLLCYMLNSYTKYIYYWSRWWPRHNTIAVSCQTLALC
jgi:hypothetical protein